MTGSAPITLSILLDNAVTTFGGRYTIVAPAGPYAFRVDRLTGTIVICNAPGGRYMKCT